MSFGRKWLAQSLDDAMELEMASWTAPWRAESLDHYLKLGWCFGAHRANNASDLLGFALAQPVLFFRGHTQSVWVEAIVGETDEARRALLEALYKWARDKHMQKLVLHSAITFDSLPWPAQKIEGEWQIATTKGN